ncbi:MAG TPA: GNAT family N-acetyltransferase [Polyangiaceae bacterium]|jgi:predicted N-acyltransferase|nr:GNAT family N-acetyltransferase [Polyangiaceae bacterium]
MLKLQTHEAISAFPEDQWNALLGAQPEPHLRWAFLEALEITGCVKPEVGWAPCHLGLYDDERLVAAAPAYLKANSEGEFVFDFGWAEFAQNRLGIEYYPKLLLAVPFTPATGRRLLIAPGQDKTQVRAALLQGVAALCKKMDISGAHILFPDDAELESFNSAGLLHRHGVQYHWHNPGYGSFDDFLSRFSSKRRNQIKRERREVIEQGIQIEVVSGKEATPAILDSVYEFYRNTVARHFYGRRYLNRAFFEEVCARMPEEVCLVLARTSAGATPVAGAFNLLGGNVMYGRYWGSREEHSFLHFEVCYYRGIEESIARGLTRFEPGAGGEHKLSRGFEPTLTHSYHLLRDHRLAGAVADFLGREQQALARYRDEEMGVLKPWSKA